MPGRVRPHARRGARTTRGALGPRTTLVHATHLTERDIELLGGSRSTVCMCPLTEADLADGVGPAPALAAAGLAAVARQRRAQRHRPGRGGPLAGAVAAAGDQAARATSPPPTWPRAATASGHACLGWPDAGEIVPGAYADLVTIPLDSPRLAGGAAADPLAARVRGRDRRRHQARGGVRRDVVRDGRHLLVEDVPRELAAAIGAVLD